MEEGLGLWTSIVQELGTDKTIQYKPLENCAERQRLCLTGHHEPIYNAYLRVDFGIVAHICKHCQCLFVERKDGK